jgi:DNA-binding transcriptional MerR regulator/methylmalonyl-CoA mutase cobalamin-binding subunit
MSQTDPVGTLRIGELARRTGVTPELLRAWEQRYGLLRPSRSRGGFRLYSEDDERRVRTTTALIQQGLSAAEAARRALEEGSAAAASPDQPMVTRLGEELATALDGFDAERAHAVFDQLVAGVSVESVLHDVVLPYLRELGDRWERGEISIAQEHFASNLIRGRLMGLARDRTGGSGPTIVLACPPGEEHDLGLIVFGISIARRGRRVVFLGADTPLETVRETVAATSASAVVLAVTRPETLHAMREDLRELAAATALLVCGAGAEPDAVAAVGAEVLRGDPVTAAGALTR